MNVAKAQCVEVDCKRTSNSRIANCKWEMALEPCPLCVPFYLTVETLLGSCEILERGGRLVGVIPSADACILA